MLLACSLFPTNSLNCSNLTAINAVITIVFSKFCRVCNLKDSTCVPADFQALAPSGGEISLQLISVNFISSHLTCFLGGEIVTDAKRTATLAIRAFRPLFVVFLLGMK